MYYRLTQLFLLGCYIIHLTESVFIFNLTNTNKILCHSCKGSDCERISDDEDTVIICNKHTQLCWAGFVDQQAYRTCASRYCTPSGISLDSDIRIETCCHSNLCNNIPLSWSIWNKWYKKTTTRRPETPRAPTAAAAVTRPTTIKKPPATARMYVVNEIVNDGKKSSNKETNEEQEDSLLPRLKFNASDPASFGINWARVPYDKDFSNRVASISKLLILIMPVLLALLF